MSHLSDVMVDLIVSHLIVTILRIFNWLDMGYSEAIIDMAALDI